MQILQKFKFIFLGKEGIVIAQSNISVKNTPRKAKLYNRKVYSALTKISNNSFSMPI